MTGITISTGPKNASQDAGGRRMYTWQGRRLPSVTSVPKLAGIPDRLHRWFVGNLIDYVLANVSNIGLRMATGDDREVKSLRSDLWRAVNGEQRARIVGIAVHRSASIGEDPNTVHPEIAPKLRQYLDWRATSGIEILASEFQVWNLTEGYAGTVDLLGRFPDGSVWIVDLKTGKGVYTEAVLQLMAYAMAEFAGADDVVDERVSGLLRQVAGIGVLHLGDDGWEFMSLRIDTEAWTAFRGLLRFGTWITQHDSIEGLVAARRRSDGATIPSDTAQRPLGWVWARLPGKVAHYCPPEGDRSLCLRPVPRAERTLLETQPDDACRHCASKAIAA